MTHASRMVAGVAAGAATLYLAYAAAAGYVGLAPGPLGGLLALCIVVVGVQLIRRVL